MTSTLILLASAALLANPAADPPQPQKQKDPNRMVCEMVEVSGSHFAKQRVCMTAAEWANARQADRDAIERIQMSTCVNGAGC